MKILLVHCDKTPWASTHRAEALKREWKDKVDIVSRWELPDGDKYDVIHILHSGGMTKFKDWILKYKEKTFTTLASQRTLDGVFDKLEDLVEIYKNTVYCVCQNENLAYQLKRLIKKNNVVYIPNGVDEHVFDKRFVVGFVGARDSREHKGYQLIQKACDDLSLEFKTIRGVELDKMPEFYREIDCLVLASLSEGCNNPTLEALAMNIPVISTKVGIVEELEGVTLVDRDVESIKKALRKLSGRIQILEKYTWKKIATEYRNLYVRYNPNLL